DHVAPQLISPLAWSNSTEWRRRFILLVRPRRMAVPCRGESVALGSLLGSELEGASVSLRSRLTTAFLVVVLGPVLVGAVFVAAVMSHLAESREMRLADAAVTMVDSTLGTICECIQA